jgi:hypothetical protein
VSYVFVYRSFYGMRIGREKRAAEVRTASAD